MASIETLINRVIDKVKTEEETKLASTKEELAQELTDEKERISRQEEASKETIQVRIDNELQRKKQSYINELRNNRLRAKQDLLTGVYDSASNELALLSVKKFQKLIRKVLKQLDVSEPTELIIGAKSTRQLDQAAFKELQTEFPQLTIKHEVIRGEGGFIISQQGMDYNFTFNKLITENKDVLSSELTRMAF